MGCGSSVAPGVVNKMDTILHNLSTPPGPPRVEPRRLSWFVEQYIDYTTEPYVYEAVQLGIRKMPFGKNKTSLSGLGGCFMATYKIQPNYVYSERHRLYVDSLDTASALPPPHPPSCPREDIYTPSDFVEIDRRAEQAPANLVKEPYPKLLTYLFESIKYKDKNQEPDKLKDDLLKVRAIYRWVTGQHVDTMAMPKKNPDPATPLFQLWRIKNKKGNFAQLVSILCRLADIPCVIIHGKMKGSTYDVGQPIDDKQHYGEWNAVLLGGDWRLLNAYWGACAVGSSGGDEWLDVEQEKSESPEKEKEEKKGFMFTCDENYFLADPRQLISTHLPFCSEWQLRQIPITAERFEEMAFLKDRFFNMGLAVISHKNCVITSNSGEVDILFEIAKDNIYHKYYCLLFRQEGKTVEGFSPRYDRYLFLHKPKSNQLLIKIRSPVAGTFRLELVGMDTRDTTPGYDYDWIALYKIQFTKAKERCQPFPDQPPLGWGPGLALRNTGLYPLSHTNGIVKASSTGETEIEFRIEDKDKVEKMRFVGKISRGGVKEEKLRDRAVYRIKDDKLIFNVRLPRKGEYALKLFSVTDATNQPETNFCNYMLVSTQKKQKEAYPRGFDKALGVKDSSERLGIEPLSHKVGIIRTETNEVKLDFRLTQPVEHSCSLIGNELMISDSKRLVSEAVFEDIVTYTVRLPKTGSYGFKVIAKPADRGVFESVADYIIDFSKPDKEGLVKKSSSFLLVDLPPETPIETPVPDETPEDEVKKRVEAAILTEDVAELGKAVNDLKEIAKNIQSPREEMSPREKEEMETNKDTDAADENIAVKDKNEEMIVGSLDGQAGDETSRDKTTQRENDTSRDKNSSRDNEVSVDNKTEKDNKTDDKTTPIMEKEEVPKPIANGIKPLLPPPITIGSPANDEPEVIKSMMAEVNAAEEKERAEQAKEELARAERELQILKVKKELTEAIAARDLNRLQAITKLIRDKSYQSAMAEEMKKAKSLMERLHHIKRLLHDILELDNNTIAEIKGYSAPPPAVSKVVTATLLILGHFVEETKDWIKVQNIFGKTGKESVKRRVEEFDINKLQPDIALGAKAILKDLTLDQVRVVSAGAATFYVWTKGLINEIETRLGEDINEMRPRTSKSRRARRASKGHSKHNKLSPLTRVDL